jgi:hypothetical protein
MQPNPLPICLLPLCPQPAMPQVLWKSDGAPCGVVVASLVGVQARMMIFFVASRMSCAVVPKFLACPRMPCLMWIAPFAKWAALKRIKSRLARASRANQMTSACCTKRASDSRSAS